MENLLDISTHSYAKIKRGENAFVFFIFWCDYRKNYQYVSFCHHSVINLFHNKDRRNQYQMR